MFNLNDGLFGKQLRSKRSTNSTPLFSRRVKFIALLVAAFFIYRALENSASTSNDPAAMMDAFGVIFAAILFNFWWVFALYFLYRFINRCCRNKQTVILVQVPHDQQSFSDKD